jgi:superfamily II DNA or RNA helicase
MSASGSQADRLDALRSALRELDAQITDDLAAGLVTAAVRADTRIEDCRALDDHSVEVSGAVPLGDEEYRTRLVVARAGLRLVLSPACSCRDRHNRRPCLHALVLGDRLLEGLEQDEELLGLVVALLKGANLARWVDAPVVTESDRLKQADRDTAALFAALAGENPPAEPEAPMRALWMLARDGNAVVVRLMRQDRGQRGTWLKPKRIEPHQIDDCREFLATEDLALAQSTMGVFSYRRYGGGGGTVRRLADMRLLRHRPLVVNHRLEAVRWDEGELETAVVASGEGWKLGFPQLDGHAWSWTAPLDDGVVAMAEDGMGVTLLAGTPAVMRLFHRRAHLHLGQRTVQSEAFRTVAARLTMNLPAELAGEAVETDAGAHLLLAWEGELLVARIAVRPLPELPWQDPGVGHDHLHARRLDVGGARWVMAVRRLDEERSHAVALAERVGLPASGWHHRLPLAAAADLVGRLAAVGVAPQWSGPPTRTSEADATHLRVRVVKTRDWLEVEAGLRIDEHTVALADLLAAARSEGRWLKVDGERLVRLSEDLARRVRQLAAAGAKAAPAVAPLIDEAVAGLDGTQLDVDRAWQDLHKKLRAAQDFTPRLPTGFTATLRDYQRAGFVWMARLAQWGAGAVLADDMGLGKTVQTIAMLLHRAKLGPALVVCPTSVEGNWCDEIARFAPKLRVQLFRADRDLAKLAAGDVLLASYGLVQRQAETFASRPFASLVLDEAQHIKNADAKRTHALAAVDAGWRLGLSGTPLENRLDELWSLMNLVVPGLLGTRDRFAHEFADAIETGHDAGKREELRRRIAPFLLRRTKSQVATELPARTDIIHRVDLPPAERELYEGERLRAARELERSEAVEADRRFAILAALTRLRQLACAPGLVIEGHGAVSAKLDALVDLMEDLRASGHRALIFSQFTRLLDLAGRRLHDAGITTLRLDGTTPAPRRRELVHAFQHGTGDGFLISLKAGGTGLNLTAADYVIHLDPWWNPSAEDQATDRAHRIGQTRPVTVYRLVATGTIEDRILELHREKRDLIDALLAEGDRAGALSSAQLLELIVAGG